MPCEHCGMFHPGSGLCPRIKDIEYFENGQIKRVEYHAILANQYDAELTRRREEKTI